MTTHNQEISKDLVKKATRKRMKRSDYLRINLLFAKWRNWLFYLTSSYVGIFIVWSSINRRMSTFCSFVGICTRSYYNIPLNTFSLSLRIAPILVIMILLRGLVFCADGIVSSWLKSPFGQITYSINKAGIDPSESDEIVTVLTEINEHFKETFKKFGIFAISGDFGSIYKNLLLGNHFMEKASKPSIVNRASEKESDSKVVSGDVEGLLIASLFVPIFLALRRIKSVEKTINNLEFEND